MGNKTWYEPGLRESYKGSSGGSEGVPESATMLLLGTGLVGLAGFRRFKK